MPARCACFLSFPLRRSLPFLSLPPVHSQSRVVSLGELAAASLSLVSVLPFFFPRAFLSLTFSAVLFRSV